MATDFRIGAARIVGRHIIEAELADAWKLNEARVTAMSERLAKDWHAHSTEFDQLSWSWCAVRSKDSLAVRDAAEYSLNIIVHISAIG
jgi:hypothetical protein